MLISGVSRDIPVSAIFKLERVIPGYPHICMLKIAYSELLNALCAPANKVIWISSWKLCFSSAAAAWLGGSLARHCALAWRRTAGASFGTLTGRRRGRLVSGEGTILPGCWRRSRWCWWRRCSLVQLFSFADAPPALQGWSGVWSKPRCTL